MAKYIWLKNKKVCIETKRRILPLYNELRVLGISAVLGFISVCHKNMQILIRNTSEVPVMSTSGVSHENLNIFMANRDQSRNLFPVFSWTSSKYFLMSPEGMMQTVFSNVNWQIQSPKLQDVCNLQSPLNNCAFEQSNYYWQMLAGQKAISLFLWKTA